MIHEMNFTTSDKAILNCGKTTIHLESKKTGEHVLRAMTCNKIECPKCNQSIVARINKRVRYIAQQERLYFFNTLTSKQGLDDLVDIFTRIRKEMTLNGTIEGYMKRKKVDRVKAEKWYFKKKEKMIRTDVRVELEKICRTAALIEVAKIKKVHYLGLGMDERLSFRNKHKIFINRTYNKLLSEKIQDEKLIFELREKIEKRFVENEFSDFKYICVVEFHKSGLPHYHFLSNKYIPHYIMKRFTTEGVSGVYDNTYIVEDAMKKNPNLTEQDVNTDIVSNYVTKLSNYMTKETLDTYVEAKEKGMKKIKLITSSQGLKVSDHDSEEKEKKYIKHGYFNAELNANSYVVPVEYLPHMKDFVLERSVRKEDSFSKLVVDEADFLGLKDRPRDNYIISRRLQQISETQNNSLNGVSVLNNTNLSDEQITVINDFISNKVSLLLGYAGTGKSYTIAAMLDVLKLRKDKTFIMSYTGKASTRLKELLYNSFGLSYVPTTIHKACSSNFSNEFLRNENNVIDCEYLIIDEVSMIPRSVLAKLLLAIPTNVKILFAGDNSQLPPVNDVSIISELQQVGIKTNRLTKVFRSGDKVLSKAYNVLDKVPFEYEKYVEEDLESLVLTLLQKDFQILTNTKKMTYLINQIAQRGKNQITKCYNDFNYNVGDRVMIIANSTPRKVSNGDMAVIHSFDDESVYLKLDVDSRIVEYRYVDTEEIVPAYAFTIHKSQGSEYEKVALLLEHQKDLNTNNLLYTGVTRAKSIVEVYFPSDEAYYHSLYNEPKNNKEDDSTLMSFDLNLKKEMAF